MGLRLKSIQIISLVFLYTSVQGCDSKSQIQVPSTVKNDCADDNKNQDDNSSQFELVDVPNYEDDIADILDDNCLSCHDKGGNDPELHNWSTVEDAKRKIVSAVENERMPPSEDLDESDRETVLDWGETGYTRRSSGLSNFDNEEENDNKKNNEDGNQSTSSSNSDCN
jgi:hypothetical protein